MKKAIITIFAVAIFTLVFIFCFRYISGASSVTQSESINAEEIETDAVGDLQNVPNDSEGADTDASGEDLRAEEDVRAEEIKDYIKERIIPVVVGVLTSLSAVLASLGAIKKSLTRLSGARDDFKNEASERKSEFARQSALLEDRARELSELAKLIPQLENELCELKTAQEKLSREAYNIGKMVSLGFSGSQAVIRSGNGRKIAALLSECRALSGKKDDEAGALDGEHQSEQATETDAYAADGAQINKKASKKGKEAQKNEEN